MPGVPLLLAEPIVNPAYVPDADGAIAAFDIGSTIVSQYANSPIILAIVDALGEALDQSSDLNRFYDLVWNVDTAQGYGLDVWGRIVGVRRVLRIPEAETYLGFTQDAAAQTFGHGIWYGAGSATDNYSLSDTAYRKLILAKAAFNITDGSSLAINRIMMALFPGYGNCYVRDDGGMAMTYVFGAELSAVDYAIVTQSGALPRPAGVSASAETP